MTVYYSLLGRPLSSNDHAREWKNEGLTGIVVKLEFAYHPEQCRKTREVVAYAGEHHFTVDRWQFRADDRHACDDVRRINKMIHRLGKAVSEFESAGLRCRVNGKPASDYIRSRGFLGYVCRMM
jgi:hypothetical protein